MFHKLRTCPNHSITLFVKDNCNWKASITLALGDSDTGFGIIYLESFNGKTLTGIMYIIEQEEAPKRLKVELSKL